MLNACVLISRRAFVNGEGLAHELWRPLRKKATQVIISTLSAESFLPVERGRRDRIELLTVCRLVRTKRVDVLLGMTRLLLDRGIDARLTVVGDGPLRPDLAKKTHDLGLEGYVVFTGYIDDRLRLRELYRRSNVFVLATETEGISLAIQEAMAAGLAVVATDAGALAHFLCDGVDSLVVHDPDPKAFADAVSRLATSRRRRWMIAEAGQKKVSRLGNEAWVDQMADLLALDQAHRRGPG
jgi:glycosyltransferase involved in cell wall biosynthesis